jgi:hypothetical protein
MNVDILKSSRDFQAFMERVKELGNDAVLLIKTETDLIKIGRAQGRMQFAEDVAGLLAQVEAEQTFEKEQED